MKSISPWVRCCPQAKAWWLIISYGIFQFIINACMACMVAWFTYLAVTNADMVAAGPMGEMFAGMGGLAGQGAMVLFMARRPSGCPSAPFWAFHVLPVRRAG